MKMKTSVLLLVVAASLAVLGGNQKAVAQELPTLTPIVVTPRADGSIVHVVGPNDTFWMIAIQYAPVLEMTAEEALPYIQELNGNPTFVVAGQELLIREATSSAATPTVEGTVVSPTLAAESTPAAEGQTTPTPEGDVVVVEGQPLDATPSSEATQVGQAAATGICVSTFEDTNGNGVIDADTEVSKADAAITLFKDGQTISTYITNVIEEEHCFEDLEPGAYQVQLFPPANYVATTADSWTVTLSEGVLEPVEFGLQFQETAVADTGSTETGVDNVDTAETPAEDSNTEASDGLFTNAGTIVVIVAIILILLAGAGVVMLRRG